MNAFAMNVGVLDSAPAAWRRVPLWTIAKRRDITGRPDAELLSVYRDRGVIPKSSRDDNHNQPSDDLSAYKHVRPGDLVLNKMKTWQGSLAVSRYSGIVSPAYIVCELSGGILPRFAHYLLRSRPYVHLYESLSYGVRPSQWDLRFEDFRQIPVLLPPHEQQWRIAKFLDIETARIGRLKNERERQLDVIAERERSAVTEVFFSAVSAVETPFKHLLASRPRYGVLVPDFVDDGVPFIRVNDLAELQSGASRLRSIPASLSARYKTTVVREGDILVSVVGTLGRAAIVDSRVVGANVARAVAVVRVNGNVDRGLMLAWLRGTQFERQALLATGTDSAQPTLGMRDLANFSVRWPQLFEEQQKMADEVANIGAEMSTLRAMVNRQISLLWERQQALITAAVTGQIDVAAARGAL